jgi:hypothetical protein
MRTGRYFNRFHFNHHVLHMPFILVILGGHCGVFCLWGPPNCRSQSAGQVERPDRLSLPVLMIQGPSLVWMTLQSWAPPLPGTSTFTRSLRQMGPRFLSQLVKLQI